MNKKYEVRLQVKEREWIETLLHADATSKGIRHRCLVLLLRMKIKVRFQRRLRLHGAQGSAKLPYRIR